MDDLDQLVESLNAEAEGEFEKRLTEALSKRDRRWLEKQIVEHVHAERHVHGGRHRQLGRQEPHVESVAERKKRLLRIRGLGLDAAGVRETAARYRKWTREALIEKGLLKNPPHKGKEAVDPAHRTEAGGRLLTEARDFFYALLFCDAGAGVALKRTRRDFLTVTLPSSKKAALESFMLAVTETHAAGTWLDPEGVSDDVGARNTVLQVEFGDTADDLVCDALIAVLGLINNLEVNEQILYARIEKLARSTLVQ